MAGDGATWPRRSGGGSGGVSVPCLCSGDTWPLVTGSNRRRSGGTRRRRRWRGFELQRRRLAGRKGGVGSPCEGRRGGRGGRRPYRLSVPERPSPTRCVSELAQRVEVGMKRFGIRLCDRVTRRRSGPDCVRSRLV